MLQLRSSDMFFGIDLFYPNNDKECWHLPTYRTLTNPPMMITLNVVPANNLLKPNTEKNPALPAISNA